jgi:hypothetical protein
MYRRAKFIWTPKQPVDHSVTFRSLLVHGPVRRESGTNRWLLFRREFELPGPADAAQIAITADSRYVLHVNGSLVGRGPARAAPAFLRVDSHDVAAQLRAGRNVVAVLVHVYGVDTAWYEVARDYAQSIFGDGGLYVDATVHAGSQIVSLVSDGAWRVHACTAWRADTPRSGWGQGFIEDHDARRMPEGWELPGFDDSDWDQAQVLVRKASAEDQVKGWGDIEPFSTLVPRDFPPLAESAQMPAEIIGVYEVEPGSALELDRQLYDEPLVAARPGCAEGLDALLRDDGPAALVRTSAGKDVCIVMRFAQRHSGYPFLEVEALGGEVIDVAVAETIPGEYASGTAAMPRLARQSYLDCAHVFRYTARAGRQRFEKLDWTAVKYLQLVVRNAPAGLRLLRVGSTYTHFPVEYQGEFACSDEVLTRLWSVGRYTTLQCTHDAWEDCPGREKRQWIGDGIVHYLIDAAAFGPGSQAIDRHFLLQALESQRPDGLLEMFAPGDHHLGGIIIPDFNLHWLCAAHHYLMHTGDAATVEQLLPAMQRVLAWFDRQARPNGLLADLPHWHFIEWANVGRAGESFTVNALWVAALEAAAAAARMVGYARLEARSLESAARVRQALRARHYDARRGVFVDSVDTASGRQDLRVSQQANAMAILSGVAERVQWDRIVERITDDARLRHTACPPVAIRDDPFDAETDVVRANTYFSHFLYAALGRAGRFELALEQMRRLYGPMLATGTETLWESFEPVASLCHAFSATAVYQLSAFVLGVTPAEPGFARAIIAPQFADLRWARGAYPTPHGPIRVEWSRVDERLVDLCLVVPPGVSATLQPPVGYRCAAASSLTSGEHRLRVERAG